MLFLRLNTVKIIVRRHMCVKSIYMLLNDPSWKINSESVKWPFSCADDVTQSS